MEKILWKWRKNYLFYVFFFVIFFSSFSPFSSLFNPWGFERQTWGELVFPYADNVALMMGFQKNIPWFTFSWLGDSREGWFISYDVESFCWKVRVWRTFTRFHSEADDLIGRCFLAPSGFDLHYNRDFSRWVFLILIQQKYIEGNSGYVELSKPETEIYSLQTFN